MTLLQQLKALEAERNRHLRAAQAIDAEIAVVRASYTPAASRRTRAIRPRVDVEVSSLEGEGTSQERHP